MFLNNGLFGPDHLHLNEEGYELVGGRVAEVIEKLLKDETESHVAVEKALEAVKKSARHTCESNMNDGVAHWIDDNLF